jgi:hypothetical protein
VAINELLPVPEGVTEHHPWSLLAVHDELVETVKLVLPEGEVTFWFEGVIARVGALPVWVTNTTTGDKPATETVMLATLVVTDVFSV